MPPVLTALGLYKNSSVLTQAATSHTSAGKSPEVSLGQHGDPESLTGTHTQHLREVSLGETMLSESIHWLQRT